MKLKPCPFCGGEVTLEEMETHPEYKYYEIYCYKCRLVIKHNFDPEFKTKLVKLWNRRAKCE